MCGGGGGGGSVVVGGWLLLWQHGFTVAFVTCWRGWSATSHSRRGSCLLVIAIHVYVEL